MLTIKKRKEKKRKNNTKEDKTARKQQKKRNTNIRGGQVWSLRIIITQPSLFISFISTFSFLSLHQ